MLKHRRRTLAALASLMTAMPLAVRADQLPEGFVHLREVAPSIRQDLRYFGHHNFIGQPIDGYLAPECILTRPAAEALKAVQETVAASGLRVKVFDCYRPRRAVAHFVRWSRDPGDQRMKAEFYPNVDKSDFFRLGYVAERSGHSRGSTVDLVLEQHGLRVIIDPQSLRYMEGASIDYIDSPAGGGFHIDNPNAASSCSSGALLARRAAPHWRERGSTCQVERERGT
jgi:D-alanyl-D-alanine dipeptidase